MVGLNRRTAGMFREIILILSSALAGPTLAVAFYLISY
jgi:hypothetical protein